MPAAEDDAEVGGVPVEEHLVAVSELKGQKKHERTFIEHISCGISIPGMPPWSP